MDQPGNNTGWLLKKVRRGQVWCALLSLSLALSVATAVERAWSASPGSALVLENRALDATVATARSAVPDSAPSGAFYLALAGSFLVLYLLASLFNGWIFRGLLGEALEREKSGVLLLSQFALALYVLRLIGGDAVPGSLRTLIHLSCGLLLLAMVGKYLLVVTMRKDKKWALVWSLLDDDQLLTAMLFGPGIVLSFVALLRGRLVPLAGWPTWASFVLYLLLLLGLLAAYRAVARQVVHRPQGGPGMALYELNGATITAGAPLAWIPLGILLANELQVTLPALGPRIWGLVVVVLLVVLATVLFALHFRDRWRPAPGAVLAGAYFPALVATLASWRTHEWTRNLGTLDYMAVGKQALPAQQWSELGRLPIMDLIPSHGLADFGLQALYASLNGVQGFDMTVWLGWIPVVVGFVVIYAFLAAVTSPLLALLVTVLMPIRAAVVGQYALMLVLPVVLVVTLRRPDFRRFSILWLTSAALVLWRPQLAGPAALALIVVVGWVLLIESRDRWGPAIGSLVLVLALVPAGLLIAEVVSSEDSYAALVGFLGLVGETANREFGVLEIGRARSTTAQLLEQVLPILTVVGILYFGLRRFVRRQEPTAVGFAMLFLLVFSWLVPARYGVTAGDRWFDPSLLFLTVALLPFLVRPEAFRSREIGRSAWLLTSLVIFTTLGAVETFQLASVEAARLDLRNWRAGESRVVFDERPHAALADFLQQQLAGEETFLDLSGSPALYALTSKFYPLHEITDFRSTSESIQASQLEALETLRDKGRLPLLVFQAPARLRAAALVPPTMALSYRVSEYVYRHYLPFARVAGWDVWRERGNKRSEPLPPAKRVGPRSVQQDFNLGFLPVRWAESDPWDAVARTEILAQVLGRPMVLRQELPRSIPWAPDPNLPLPTYLHLRARPLAGDKPTLEVRYGSEPESTFRFRLVRTPPPNLNDADSVMLPLVASPKKHHLDRVAGEFGGTAYRTAGRDPWLQKFVDLTASPVVEAGVEQWITMHYRSSASGEAQFFFAGPRDRFGESRSVKTRLRTTPPGGPGRLVRVPVVGIELGDRLAGMRLDPPPGSDIEILEMKLSQRPSQVDDYMVRLTTQFQWVHSGPHPIRLSTDSQVLIESLVLRSGD